MLKDVVVVIDGLEMLDDNRPVNAILRDLRNMLSPTSAILAGCFAVEGREDDATFAESHCNADALVCILHGDQADKDDVKLIYRRVFSWSSMR